MGILLVAVAVAVTIGLVCGRLYSFVALLIVTPLLALVAFVGGDTQGWSTLGAMAVAAVSVALLQASYLVGARLRLRETGIQGTQTPALRGESRPVVSGDAGRPNG